VNLIKTRTKRGVGKGGMNHAFSSFHSVTLYSFPFSSTPHQILYFMGPFVPFVINEKGKGK